MRNVAVGLMIAGLMLLGGGLAFGLVSVHVVARTSCGNAFTADGAGNNPFSDTDTTDACAAARSQREPWPFGLITAGILGLLGGYFVWWSDGSRTKPVAGVPVA